VAAAKSGLIYMPLRSGPDQAIKTWLADLDGVTTQDLTQDFSQKTLRKWQRDMVEHRSFAVLRHPLARAHAVFCDRILLDGPRQFGQLRATLRKVHKLPIPEQAPNLNSPSGYDVAAHRGAFLAFLAFLRNNLAGQTGVRVDPSWAGQLTLLQGMAQFMMPDQILREDRLRADLPALARQIGLDTATQYQEIGHPHEDWLAAIYEPTIERAARDAYQRDYDAFGFGDWA
jgi:hypothetical protein